MVNYENGYICVCLDHKVWILSQMCFWCVRSFLFLFKKVSTMIRLNVTSFEIIVVKQDAPGQTRSSIFSPKLVNQYADPINIDLCYFTQGDIYHCFITMVPEVEQYLQCLVATLYRKTRCLPLISPLPQGSNLTLLYNTTYDNFPFLTVRNICSMLHWRIDCWGKNVFISWNCKVLFA